MTRTKAVSLLLVAIGTAAAAAVLHRGFAWHSLALPIGLAVTVPVAIAAAGALSPRRVPIAVAVLVSAVLWLVVAAAVVFRSEFRAAAPWAILLDALRGTANGWASLMGTTLPLPIRVAPQLIALPFVLTWIAAAAGAELAVRTSRPIAPAGAFLALFAVFFAITVPGQGTVTLSAAVVAVDVLILVTVRGRQRRTGLLTQFAVPAALAVALAFAAVATTPALPRLAGQTAVDPRRYQSVHLSGETQYDLLQQLAAWQTGPDAPLFTAETTQDPQYWRLAVLDHFDGVTWTSDARFTLAGGAVPTAPAAAQQTAPNATVNQQITVQGLTGFYLPTENRPTRLTGTNLAVDLSSGILASTAALKPGVSYAAISSPAPADGSTLGSASFAGAAAPIARSADAPVPAADVPPHVLDLDTAVVSTVIKTQNPYDTLRYLQTYLPEHFGIDPNAAGGSATADLDAVLAGRQQANSAQLSAIFALAARGLGLPSRLVVGFQPGTRTRGGKGGSTYLVGAHEATAWPEVHFAAKGWVPFHLIGHEIDTVPAAPAAVAGSPVALPSDVVTTPLAVPTQDPTPQTSAAPSAWVIALVAAGVVVLGAGIYVLVVLAVPVLCRRHRRTSGSHRRKVVEAWRDVLETVLAAGRAFPPSATNSRIVGLAIDAAQGAPEDEQERREPLVSALFWLGEHVDAIAFDDAETTIRDVRIAWRAADRVRRAVRRATPPRRRAAMMLSPRRIARQRTRARSRSGVR